MLTKLENLSASSAVPFSSPTSILELPMNMDTSFFCTQRCCRWISCNTHMAEGREQGAPRPTETPCGEQTELSVREGSHWPYVGALEAPGGPRGTCSCQRMGRPTATHTASAGLDKGVLLPAT